MAVFNTLREAVLAMSADDKMNCYRIKHDPPVPDKFVLSNSPANAALVLVGADNVSICTQKERYNAAMEALNEKHKKAEPAKADGAK